MSKPKRGKNAKRVKGWRGTCAVCERTGVRVLWEASHEGNKVKCCKVCAG